MENLQGKFFFGNPLLNSLMLLAADSELIILENLNAIKGMFEDIDIYPPIDNFSGNLPYLTIFLSVFLGVVIGVTILSIVGSGGSNGKGDSGSGKGPKNRMMITKEKLKLVMIPKLNRRNRIIGMWFCI